ncbi:transcriptional regulator [Solwaraspora sp. WMMA2101]|uniref:transcriptional regulator n=1 Tax=Solwaraspora sp. WMMA2101 TaxID=3404124 RepID=UPI003B934B17
MQAEHTSVAAWHTVARIRSAADDHDADRIATLIVERIAADGVVPTWQRICLPLLAGTGAGDSGPAIAAEHTLSEGIRAGLDRSCRTRGRVLMPSGALLAAVEREQHSLALHAIAAGLRERGYDCLLLGAALPWTALTDAVRRWQPRTVIVWAQTTVTARTAPLVRLGRDFPALRRCAAGPGWPHPLPPQVVAVGSLAGALRAALANG